MDHQAVLALFDRHLRLGARPDAPGTRIERVGAVVRQVGGDTADDHGEWTGVVWSDLGADPAAADAEIAAQVRDLSAAGRPFEWKLYGHDRPGDLADRLRAAGFVAEAAETLMVADIDAMAPTGNEPPPGVDVVPVTDAAGVDLVADVHSRVFGSDRALLRHRLLALLGRGPEPVHMAVAVADGRPVGTARLEPHPGTGFASLWGGGVLAPWRGRGVYRALLAHRARIAAEGGYRHLHVDASEQSRPILARLGFAALTTTTPYVYRP